MKKWRVVILYTLLLYGSIPVARPFLHLLQDVFQSHFRLWLNVFLVGTAVGLGTVLLRGRTLTLRRWSILGGVVFVLFFLALWMDIPEERIHVLEYGGLGYLLVRAMKSGCPEKALFFPALACAFCLGAIDELFQWAWPGRVFDLWDIFYNTMSGVAGIIIRMVVAQHSP